MSRFTRKYKESFWEKDTVCITEIIYTFYQCISHHQGVLYATLVVFMWPHIQFMFWLILKMWYSCSRCHSITKRIVQYYSLWTLPGVLPLIFTDCKQDSQDYQKNRSIRLSKCIHTFYKCFRRLFSPTQDMCFNWIYLFFHQYAHKGTRESIGQVHFKICP